MDLRIFLTAVVLASVRAAEEEKKEGAPAPAQPSFSPFVQIMIIAVVVLSVFFCLYHSFRAWYRNTFRVKTDLVSLMGLALAQITNEEDQNPHNIILNGVGTNTNSIRQWVDDMWETYEVTGDGWLDRREVKKFLDQTLARVNLGKVPYTDLDLDVFFDFLDIT